MYKLLNFITFFLFILASFESKSQVIASDIGQSPIDTPFTNDNSKPICWKAEASYLGNLFIDIDNCGNEMFDLFFIDCNGNPVLCPNFRVTLENCHTYEDITVKLTAKTCNEAVTNVYSDDMKTLSIFNGDGFICSFSIVNGTLIISNQNPNETSSDDSYCPLTISYTKYVRCEGDNRIQAPQSSTPTPYAIQNLNPEPLANNVQITVFDQLGRTIRQLDNHSVLQNYNGLLSEMPELPAGLYLLLIQEGENIKTHKIVKQ